ncbi:AAA-ATPase At3g50940 [Quercus suber]|uniref:AAA-ATPase At3g50940 n=1 Tax=Quercus suber TaxID=58331 RepID=UPI000CE1D6F7|nr:AAA-ATPase At3g50940-like [Quercus suber]
MFIIMEMLKSLAPYFTAAVVIVLSPFAKERIPVEVSNYLVSTFKKWLARFSTPEVTVVIEERGDLTSNQIYKAARAYLRTLIHDSTKLTLVWDSTKPRRFKVSKEDRQKESIIDVVKDVHVIDNFREITLKWGLRTEREEGSGIIKKCFELSFDKGYETDVLESYLADIVDRYERIQKAENVVKIYTCNEKVRGSASRYLDRDRHELWRSVSLEHPATFEKLAMNPEQKQMLKDDLDRFLAGKDLYEKVGKTWKRGYLLYGPPGTGKTSLIAAMANYLKFNIYDLNLSSMFSNEDLRNILLSTTNRSILVIEDIGRGTNFKAKKKENYSFTLSGLLNMIDGLWSSCGDERIIVFTTNHKDRLDPALLRPGRMDLHVHMSYCTMDGFKLLASNYLNIEADHQLYRQIEGLLENVEVTPAEIAEELLKSGGTDVVLGGLVKFLEQKTLQKAKAAELKELLKSDDNTDVDVKEFAKFLKQEKLKNAKAAEAEQLLKIDHTYVDVDDDVEGLVKLFKQKKIEDAKAAEAVHVVGSGKPKGAS